MSDIAIRVEGLGKQYRIGKRERYKTLRDTLTDVATAPFRRARALFGGAGTTSDAGSSELIWALKNISFEVPRGSVVGVIGRNGAGKSTLLKVLSRITEPTEGRVEIHGRVGSLLEVGTGFHPELTGRENIFLNGAILGMRRAEIERKFDEIVAFAEIEKFIDTPVKHYSSGMYMRLAFAVAAHLEPEILIVDEVLAVGDAQFQKKCMGKMGEVAKAGRTVVFVSHSMAAVSSLCDTGILLDRGFVSTSGPIDATIDEYTRAVNAVGEVANLRDAVQSRGNGDARITEVSILNDAGEPSSRFEFGDTVSVELKIEPGKKNIAQMCAVVVSTASGIPVLHLMASEGRGFRPAFYEPPATVRCTIPRIALYPGTYTLSLWIGSSPYSESDYRSEVLRFHVDQGPMREIGFDLGWRHGLVHAECSWRVVAGAVLMSR